MATIADVARRADVSTGTVSRVLNGHPSVRGLTRRAVLAAIEELGYQPNPVARNLRRARTGVLGVVVNYLDNQANLATLNTIAEQARERGVSLFYCDCRGSIQRQAAHLSELLARRVDGVLLQPAGPYQDQIKPLQQAGIPIILGGLRAPSGALPQVVIDEYDSSVAAYRHLLQLGHRRIALLQRWSSEEAPAWHGTGRNRAQAYLQAHAACGLPVDASLIVGAINPEEGGARMAALLRAPGRPTALVCGPHYFTPSVLLAIRRAGLSVPDDISVICYGDSPWAEAFNPPLSVVRTDYQQLGRNFAGLYFAPPSAPGAQIVRQPSELLLRESCAPPRT